MGNSRDTTARFEVVTTSSTLLTTYGHGGEPSGADGGGWNKLQENLAPKRNASWPARASIVETGGPIGHERAYRNTPICEDLGVCRTGQAGRRRVEWLSVQKRNAGKHPAADLSQSSRFASAAYLDRLFAMTVVRG